MLEITRNDSHDLKDTCPQIQTMHWRAIREADLVECLEIQPACIGDRRLGRDVALGIWRELLDSPAFNANIIESELPLAGRRIVGCGMGVFVDRAFVDRELEDPGPGLNQRIIESIASGNSVVLERDAIAAGNAGHGLDFVNLYGSWHEGILDADQLADVQMLLGLSFAEALTGYRFNRILKETIGQATISLARATGTYRLVADYPECASALFCVSPESARTAPYSVATAIYRYQAPVLHLRPAEQALLAAALNGRTDAELSTELDLSIEAIKKRWLSIFARVDQFRPAILASTDADADGTRRGPQKRHRVVAYIRAHPEELRPYAWNSA